MFQSYALFPHMSVEDNIAFGLRREGLRRTEIRQRVGEALELIQMRGLRPPPAASALRRPAPARGARPRRGQAAAGPAARRAALGARQEAAREHAVRAGEHPGEARHHLHHGHPRPGGGDDHVHAHRRHVARAASSRSARRARSTSGPAAGSSPTSSARSICSTASLVADSEGLATLRCDGLADAAAGAQHRRPDRAQRLDRRDPARARHARAGR